MTLKKVFVTALSALLLLGSFSSAAFAQSSLSRIRGTVMDSQGAVVPGAEVVVKDNATDTEYKTKSGDDGSFTVAALPVSTYTVTASFAGFKQTVVSGVKTIVAETVAVEVKLEAGATSESVTVTGGAEVLQKETTAIGSVITGRQISELPFTSRNALDLVMYLPGTSTPGRPRTSSVNGAPAGFAQHHARRVERSGQPDQVLRRLLYLHSPQHRCCCISTTSPSTGSAGEGAVQIKFVTKSGTNQYHGVVSAAVVL